MIINNFNTSDAHEQSEIWKPIEGYENLYEVSNLGRVRSITHYSVDRLGRNLLKKGRVLKSSADGNGYLFVRLFNHSEKKDQQLKVHRLVAKAFIPNPQNLPCINHKNEVKTDNSINNLEWCTVDYNNKYGTRTQRAIDKEKIPIEAIDFEGNVVLRFESGNEAKRNGYCNAMLCCRGLYKTCGGYRWRFA